MVNKPITPKPAESAPAASKPTTPRRQGVSKKGLVQRFLIDNPNIEVHYGQIAAATGLSEREVSQTIWHIREKGMNVQRLGGGVLRYTPGASHAPAEEAAPADASKLVYQQLGVASNGDHVIEGSDGVLYRASPM